MKCIKTEQPTHSHNHKQQVQGSLDVQPAQDIRAGILKLMQKQKPWF